MSEAAEVRGLFEGEQPAEDAIREVRDDPPVPPPASDGRIVTYNFDIDSFHGNVRRRLRDMVRRDELPGEYVLDLINGSVADVRELAEAGPVYEEALHSMWAERVEGLDVDHEAVMATIVDAAVYARRV